MSHLRIRHEPGLRDTNGGKRNMDHPVYNEEERALVGTWIMDEVYKVWSYEIDQFDKATKTGGLFTSVMVRSARLWKLLAFVPYTNLFSIFFVASWVSEKTNQKQSYYVHLSRPPFKTMRSVPSSATGQLIMKIFKSQGERRDLNKLASNQ
ncbi:hypothetical protein NQ315_014660 [Exocentrus adspersus]|uniref:Uncharacterized protein n=1 Tax=Exocentrus adspersus TaxID=1586481 RepID=A0AAV8VR52_9CUCU|nr:hypothetical protein NQ315_014660 [Exocentrus adspersus]